MVEVRDKSYLQAINSMMLPAVEPTVHDSETNAAVGVRYLDLLGEFKPFGLIAEALEGNYEDNVDNGYNYFLFDPNVAKDRDETRYDGVPNDQSDHEIFFRGNRIIWSAGAQVYKRFTTTSPAIKVCWCHLPDTAQALLCVLQAGILEIYSTSGEVASIPLPRNVESIWPLPFGLLLQNGSDESLPMPNSSLHSTSSICDISRFARDLPHNLQNNSGSAWLSSHVVLRDILEDPKPMLVEDEDKLNIMSEFSERIIWTSDKVPIMVSFNQGKMQHSIWAAEAVCSDVEIESVGIPSGVASKQFSCRRIWHAKGAQSSASKVFLAIDDNMTPVVCLLLQQQKKLLSVCLSITERNKGTIIDIKPDMSWSIPAIAAAPVTVTRPRVKLGLLPYLDIIVVDSDNQLLLYSGKQCLCRYSLSPPRGKSENLYNFGSSNTAWSLHDLRIVGLDGSVAGRVNLIFDNGQMIRCILRRDPLCLLTSDSICAMAETVRHKFYIHFLIQFWRNVGSASCISSEWEVFSNLVIRMSRKSVPPQRKLIESGSSWNFLINSNFHKKYSLNFSNGVSGGVSPVGWDKKCSTSLVQGMHVPERSLYNEFLVEVFYSLHAIYESLKLDSLRKRDLTLLVVLLADVSSFLGEKKYLDYYIRDFPIISKNFARCPFLHGKNAPLDIFWCLEKCLLYGCEAAKISDLPFILVNDGNSVANWGRKILSFYSILSGAKLNGKKLSNGIYCNIASGSFYSREELLVLAMVGERFGLQELDLLPAGMSLPLRHALAKCREAPPTDWCPSAYVLLGREDLAFTSLAHSTKSIECEGKADGNLLSFCTPYMLHLHPVTVPSTVSDPSGVENKRSEDIDFGKGAVMDGMEHIFNSKTQLRYGRDLRIVEVRRLLCSARPVVIQTSANLSSSDHDLQQARLWHLAQRTTALPFGRGAFTLATTYTLLTETLNVPNLVLSGRLPSQQNATVNLDSNARNVQDLKFWPEFHNAVAAGLKLAPLQGKVSRTWIMYNKPKEHNVIHSGLLFALGLHGHLRVLSIIDVYTYLAEVHERMGVGLLLGLGASYRGTMDAEIMKSFFFHLPVRHPSSFPELDVPILVQSAALLSYGLLFEGSLHQPTVHMFLGEFTRKTGGDDVLEREGYVLSAGFALGLVALGRGDGASGFADSLVEHLLPYVTGRGLQHRSSFAATTSTSEHTRGSGQVLDGNVANVSMTAPGAIMAIGLIFLKTESEQIVSKLSIPCTYFEMQHVRPDFIMLLVIARSLIMWNRICPSYEWVCSEIPDTVRSNIGVLDGGMDDADHRNLEVFVQAYVNIVTGACISIGLRFAGTKDANAQELLYDFAVYFLNEIKAVACTTPNNLPKGLSQYVDRGMLEVCLHVTVLSLSLVMAGSGHLKTFRLLRYLRSRNSVDGHASYGIQMAISLAIGFLFLGGGLQTFSTRNRSIAALLISIYPRLPSEPNDNHCHLQAFRHLYVLASEARWIQTIDVDTDLPVYVPVEITVSETQHYAETSYCEVTPCILPERSILKSVRVCGPRYWPQMMEVVPEGKPWWMPGDKADPFNSGLLYVKRRVGSCSYIDDPVGCQSLLSRAMHKVFGSTNLGSSPSGLASMMSIEQLVSTFSSNPSLIAFAQLCCDPSLCQSSHSNFQEFCFQVLFECVSKDKPALVQVYLSLYMSIWSMGREFTCPSIIFGDSLHISSLKIALAYTEALLSGKLAASDGGIVQSSFIVSMRKKVEELLNNCNELKEDLSHYMNSGCWPDNESSGDKRSLLLSWYLQWYNVPQPSLIKLAKERMKAKLVGVPLLRLFFPETHITAINDLHTLCFSS